jgi:hypothetical protein
VTGLLGLHQREHLGHNSRHHNHLRSRRLSHNLSRPHLHMEHGLLPSTCLGLLSDMLSVGISTCTSRVWVARLGLVQEVESGLCLPVYLQRCDIFVIQVALVISWGYPHSPDERAQYLSQWCGGGCAPARRVHSGLAVYVWRETSHHREGTTTAVGGVEGLLLVDRISPSTIVSLKLAWGRKPTFR